MSYRFYRDEDGCKGCFNITEERFPFRFGRDEDDDPVRSQFYIDDEGCCIKDGGDKHLRIHFCPVCGKALVSVNEHTEETGHPEYIRATGSATSECCACHATVRAE